MEDSERIYSNLSYVSKPHKNTRSSRCPRKVTCLTDSSLINITTPRFIIKPLPSELSYESSPSSEGIIHYTNADKSFRPIEGSENPLLNEYNKHLNTKTKNSQSEIISELNYSLSQGNYHVVPYRHKTVLSSIVFKHIASITNFISILRVSKLISAIIIFISWLTLGCHAQIDNLIYSEAKKILAPLNSRKAESSKELSNLVNLNDYTGISELYTQGNSTYNRSLPSTNACPRCYRRQVAINHRISLIKEKILKQLGLEKVPNINKTLPNLPPLNDLIKGFKTMQNDISEVPDEYNQGFEYEDAPNIIPKKLMLISKNYVERYKRHREDSNIISNRIYFDLDKTVYENNIKSANLWIYASDYDKVKCRNISPMLHVFQVMRETFKNSTPDDLKLRLISGKEIRHLNKWVSIDIKMLVESWIESPYSNLGFVLVAKNCLGKNIITTKPMSKQEEAYRPILDLTLSPKPNLFRKKRSLNLQCTEENPEERCCRYPLVINFADFNWDFIVAPKQAAINYCFGDCPMTFLHQSAHTYLYRLATSLSACCSPSKISAMSLLYFKEDNSIMYGVVGGMVVEQCSCS
ncbi:unnamed protein product [Gordionus sp. m RMFG-2023]